MKAAMIKQKQLVIIALLLAICVASLPFFFRNQSINYTNVLDIFVFPTINSAGITVNYQYDDNENNRAYIRFKVKGDTSWLEASSLSPIRKLKQLAGSLVYLKPDTEYEVEVRIEDPDGVNNPVLHATFKTKSNKILWGNGNSFYISPDGDDKNPGTIDKPWRSLHKINELKPGDVVYLRGGLYYINHTIYITVSGEPHAYITIRNYPGERPILYGSDENILNGKIKFHKYDASIYYAEEIPWTPTYVAQGTERLYHYASLRELQTLKTGVEGGWFYNSSTKTLFISSIDKVNPSHGGFHVSRIENIICIYGKYIYICGLEIGYASRGIVISDNCVVENCTIHNVNVGVGTTRWASNCIIQNNTIWDTGIIKWPWNMVKGTEAEGSGISLGHAGPGHIVRFNKIFGLFNGITASAWDGESLFNSSLIRDTDIYDNYILSVGDDGIEPEGSGINFRIWNNIIINSLCSVSLAPITYGPTYVFRNLCINFSLLGIKLNSGYPSSGWKYIYHNTFYTSIRNSTFSKEPPICIGSASAVYSHLVTRNNIFHLTGDNYVITGSIEAWLLIGCSFDYDNLYTSAVPCPIFTNNLNTIKNVKGMEKNGISADSNFLSPEKGDFRLKPDSPCIDAGVRIPGFNDDYYGYAPDIGALEYRP